MTQIRHALAACWLFSALLLAACASEPVRYGDKALESRLKQFTPVPEKISLYVCRAQSALPFRHPAARVLVNDANVGVLELNMFLHVVLEPGTHVVASDIGFPTSPRKITISGQSGSVVYLWIGQPGGWNPVTIDFFQTEEQARGCVSAALLAASKP